MKKYLKKLPILTTIALVLLISCSKEDENKIKIDQYTGYYNLKDAYNDDLLLKITNSKETVSYYGSTNGSSVDVLASFYKDNSSGRRTAFKANATADTSIVYNFDRPELGGILFIKKASITYVQEFKFQEDKKSIKPTFYLSKITKITNKRLAQKTGVTTIASGDIIDKGLGYFLDKLDKIVPKEDLDKIKKDSEDSSSSSKDNNKGLLDGLLNIMKNIEDYQNAQELKNIITKLNAEDPYPNPNIDLVKPLNKFLYVDCNEIKNGNAFIDDCNICVEINSGEKPCSCNNSTLAITVDIKSSSASVKITGGQSPYEVFWSNNPSTSNTAINLIPGKNYLLEVTDKLKCTVSTTIKVVGCDKSTLACTTSTTSNSATVTPIGGQAPYKFLWSNGDKNQTATNLTEGDYTITVTDDFDCSITSTVNIGCAKSTLALSTSTTSNSATANVSGGNSPYTYLWSNGNTSVTATNLTSGSYVVTVTDAQGCTKVGTAIVSSSVIALLKSKTWVITNANIIPNESFTCGGDTYKSTLQSSILTFGGSNNNLTFSMSLTGIMVAYVAGATPCGVYSNGTTVYGGPIYNAEAFLPELSLSSALPGGYPRFIIPGATTIVSVNENELVLNTQFLGQLVYNSQ